MIHPCTDSMGGKIACAERSGEREIERERDRERERLRERERVCVCVCHAEFPSHRLRHTHPFLLTCASSHRSSCPRPSLPLPPFSSLVSATSPENSHHRHHSSLNTIGGSSGSAPPLLHVAHVRLLAKRRCRRRLPSRSTLTRARQSSPPCMASNTASLWPATSLPRRGRFHSCFCRKTR